MGKNHTFEATFLNLLHYNGKPAAVPLGHKRISSALITCLILSSSKRISHIEKSKHVSVVKMVGNMIGKNMSSLTDHFVRGLLE